MVCSIDEKHMRMILSFGVDSQLGRGGDQVKIVPLSKL